MNDTLENIYDDTLNDAILFLEDSLSNNKVIDIVFVMRNFKLNRKNFDICVKLAEGKILIFVLNWQKKEFYIIKNE